MIEYLSDGRKYSFSYGELRKKYHEICGLPDTEFLDRLPEAMHFACVVCWLKEIPTYVCLIDTGIVHELAHLMHIGDENTTPLWHIRQLFAEQLKLA